jgi:hypothetical protein
MMQMLGYALLVILPPSTPAAVYNPSAPSAFHGFTEMTAGEGYFVSARSGDGIFTISCPS